MVEYWGCDPMVLNDLVTLEAGLRVAAAEAGATIVASVFHPFSPQGVTGVVVVEESHLSIHTWPESGYAAVDFFTCGESHQERAHLAIKKVLKAQRTEMVTILRGDPKRGLSVMNHHSEGRVLDAALPGPPLKLKLLKLPESLNER